MMKFKMFQQNLTLSESSVVKKFKVGKGKFEALIKKNGKKFDAFIDGQKLDTFNDVKDAEKSIVGFTKAMGK